MKGPYTPGDKEYSHFAEGVFRALAGMRRVEPFEPAAKQQGWLAATRGELSSVALEEYWRYCIKKLGYISPFGDRHWSDELKHWATEET